MLLSRTNHEIRKFVQNRVTKAFMTAGGAWTTDATTATIFPSMEAARDAVLGQRVIDAELYYQFGEEPSKYDFTIPCLS